MKNFVKIYKILKIAKNWFLIKWILFYIAKISLITIFYLF